MPQSPKYLFKREVPNEKILKVIKREMRDNKGMNEIHKDTGIPSSTVNRYYWQVKLKKW